MTNSNPTSLLRKKILGVLFAVAFGNVGAHHFYIKNYKLWFLYLVFSFTGIPAIIALVEAFYMPGRIENSETASPMTALIIFSFCLLFLAGGMYLMGNSLNPSQNVVQEIPDSDKVDKLQKSASRLTKNEKISNLLSRMFKSPSEFYNSEKILEILREDMSEAEFEGIVSEIINNGSLNMSVGSNNIPSGFDEYKNEFVKARMLMFSINTDTNKNKQIHIDLWKLQEENWYVARVIEKS